MKWSEILFTDAEKIADTDERFQLLKQKFLSGDKDTKNWKLTAYNTQVIPKIGS